MELAFKVFAEIEDGEPEVRRFGIDRSVAANFHYLEAKLLDVFPKLRGKSFTISWKDEEGDMVAISSDEELVLALGCMSENNSNLVKLFVKVNKADSPADEAHIEMHFTIPEENTGAKNTSDKEHVGVVCDGCDGPVTGFRYKCVSCPDFDLCGTCEASGKHSEHYMIRLPAPMNPHLKFGRGMAHNLFKTIHKEGLRCGKKNSTEYPTECPFAKKHKRDKYHRGADRSENNGDQPKPEPNPRVHHRHGSAKLGNGGRVGWFETFATYMNEFANLAGDMPPPPPPPPPHFECGNASGQQQSQQNAEPSAPQAPQSGTDRQQQQEQSQQQSSGPIPDYINNIEDPKIREDAIRAHHMIKNYIAVPLASVITQAATHINQTLEGHLNRPWEFSASTSTAQQQTETSNTSAEKNESPADQNKASSVPQQANPAADVEMQSAMDDTRSEVSDVSSHKETQTEARRTISPERAEGWTVITDKDMSDATNTEAKNTEKSSSPQSDNAEKSSQNANTEKSSSSQSANASFSQGAPGPGFKDLSAEFHKHVHIHDMGPMYPKLPHEEIHANHFPRPFHSQAIPMPPPPSAKHPKPHIEAALNAMLGMGFNNDGGWLTHLLESKDGNISAVLDLLSPAKRQ